MDGCQAVNLRSSFKPSCELTSGNINTNDLIDHNNSDVYVVGMYVWLLLVYSDKTTKICKDIDGMIKTG